MPRHLQSQLASSQRCTLTVHCLQTKRLWQQLALRWQRPTPCYKPGRYPTVAKFVESCCQQPPHLQPHLLLSLPSMTNPTPRASGLPQTAMLLALQRCTGCLWPGQHHPTSRSPTDTPIAITRLSLVAPPLSHMPIHEIHEDIWRVPCLAALDVMSMHGGQRGIDASPLSPLQLLQMESKRPAAVADDAGPVAAGAGCGGCTAAAVVAPAPGSRWGSTPLSQAPTGSSPLAAQRFCLARALSPRSKEWTPV